MIEACKNRIIWLDSSVKIFVFHQSIFLRWVGKWHFVHDFLSIGRAILLWSIWKCFEWILPKIIKETSLTPMDTLLQLLQEKSTIFQWCIQVLWETGTPGWVAKPWSPKNNSIFLFSMVFQQKIHWSSDQRFRNASNYSEMA